MTYIIFCRRGNSVFILVYVWLENDRVSSKVRLNFNNDDRMCIVCLQDGFRLRFGLFFSVMSVLPDQSAGHIRMLIEPFSAFNKSYRVKHFV